MALKVKAQEKLQKIGTYAGKYRYIMMPELYTSLSQEKVIKAAARALSLLLDNAMKFTPEGDGQRATLRISATACDVAFIVEDTGIGVPNAEAERIFDEFVQLNEYYDGTGIGLTVARSLAHRLSGNIVLDTTYTAGARFVMTLPINS